MENVVVFHNRSAYTAAVTGAHFNKAVLNITVAYILKRVHAVLYSVNAEI